YVVKVQKHCISHQKSSVIQRSHSFCVSFSFFPPCPPFSLFLSPSGVNRHFHMICIRDKFSQNIGRQISSKVIWDHLSTMYDMQALHESEILPFPNSEKNFILPEEIIQEVKEGKVMIEDDVKEEIKEEMEAHSAAEEGSMKNRIKSDGWKLIKERNNLELRRN
ncbi:MRG/MORF4L-binding protein-like, partial [Notechis scutatus]|uniref:MRG/MORF4L-binding protein-like n=1 Tax=Notechis scutatus TaxID=8663 RepID=A0A6J1W1F5_9SAUR